MGAHHFFSQFFVAWLLGAVTSSGTLMSFSSCTDISRGFNEVVASFTMAKLTECQEKLKESKPIEVFELREELIHLSWDIMLKTKDDNLHDNNKPRWRFKCLYFNGLIESYLNSGFWKYKKNPKLGHGKLFPSVLGKQMVCKLMEEN